VPPQANRHLDDAIERPVQRAGAIDGLLVSLPGFGAAGFSEDLLLQFGDLLDPVRRPP
jgi:hypothetical protein